MSKAAVIAVGVNAEGRREVPGLAVGPMETETLRRVFLHGPGGIQLVISDARAGLKSAVAKVPSSIWQRYRVHSM